MDVNDLYNKYNTDAALLIAEYARLASICRHAVGDVASNIAFYLMENDRNHDLFPNGMHSGSKAQFSEMVTTTAIIEGIGRTVSKEFRSSEYGKELEARLRRIPLHIVLKKKPICEGVKE